MKRTKNEVSKWDFKLILLYSLLTISLIFLLFYILKDTEIKFKFSKDIKKIDIYDEIGRFGKDIFHLIPDDGACSVKCIYKCQEIKMEMKTSQFQKGDNNELRNNCECTCIG